MSCRGNKCDNFVPNDEFDSKFKLENRPTSLGYS